MRLNVHAASAALLLTFAAPAWAQSGRKGFDAPLGTDATASLSSFTLEIQGTDPRIDAVFGFDGRNLWLDGKDVPGLEGPTRAAVELTAAERARLESGFTKVAGLLGGEAGPLAVPASGFGFQLLLPGKKGAAWNGDANVKALSDFAQLVANLASEVAVRDPKVRDWLAQGNDPKKSATNGRYPDEPLVLLVPEDNVPAGLKASSYVRLVDRGDGLMEVYLIDPMTLEQKPALVEAPSKSIGLAGGLGKAGNPKPGDRRAKPDGSGRAQYWDGSRWVDD